MAPLGAPYRSIALHLAPNISQDSPTCSQDRPRQPNLQPRSPKTAQLGLNMAILVRFSLIWLPCGTPNGSQIEENLAKKAMLSRSWAFFGDLDCKLSCLGRCWEQDGAKEATRSAKMSHQRLPDGKNRGGWVVNERVWGPTSNNSQIASLENSKTLSL